MKRILHLEVTDCAECPYMWTIPNDGYSYRDREEWYCDHKDIIVKTPHRDEGLIASGADLIHPGEPGFKIPDFCPLPKQDSFEL